MIRVGSRFRICYRRHWGFGQVFVCTALPGIRIDGNADAPALIWTRGELIEFTCPGRDGSFNHYVIPRHWAAEVSDPDREHPRIPSWYWPPEEPKEPA